MKFRRIGPRLPAEPAGPALIRLLTTRHALRTLGATCLLTLTAAPASAQAPALPRYFPQGAVEANLGWLFLPASSICGAHGCSTGDTSPTLGANALLMTSEELAFGIGFDFALFPTNPVSDASPHADRIHNRSYFSLDSLFRYSPRGASRWGGWIGPGLGLVVIGDTYEPAEGQSSLSLIGSPGVTVATHGLDLFVAGGARFPLSEWFQLGGTIRGGAWGLPSAPATSPLDEPATLTGWHGFVAISAAFVVVSPQ